MSLSAALAGLAVAVAAAPATFDSYAAHGETRISLQAWQDHDWHAALAEFDADGDGRISAAEHIAARCRISNGDPRCLYGARLEVIAIDRNHNGVLDRKEMDAVSANLFRANDLNHDGYVTREEMQRLAEGRK